MRPAAESARQTAGRKRMGRTAARTVSGVKGCGPRRLIRRQAAIRHRPVARNAAEVTQLRTLRKRLYVSFIGILPSVGFRRPGEALRRTLPDASIIPRSRPACKQKAQVRCKTDRRQRRLFARCMIFSRSGHTMTDIWRSSDIENVSKTDGRRQSCRVRLRSAA